MPHVPNKPEPEKIARWLSLAGDPTRLRILRLLYREKIACVTVIAEGLGMSMASISYHMQLLRDNGLCTMERQGNTLCYRLVQNDFIRRLKPMIT